MRIVSFLIPLFILTTALCSAQNMNAVEDLQKQLQSATADTQKIVLHCKLAFEILEADRNKAKNHIKEAEALNEKVNFRKGDLLIAYAKGMNMDYESKFDSAIRFYNEAIIIAEETNDLKWKGEALTNIGLEYVHNSEFDNALDNYIKAEDVADKINDEKLLAKIYRKRANLAMQTQQNKLGIGFIQKAIAIHEKTKDSALLGESFGSLGWAYKVEEKYDSTIFYLNKAIAVFTAKRYITFIPVAYTEIGKAYYELEDYNNALLNYNKAKAIYDTVHFEYHQDALYNYFGDAYLKLNNYNDAELNYKKGLEMSVATKDMETQSEALYGLYQTKKLQKDFAASINYFEQYDSVRNVIQNSEQLAKVAEVEEKYQSEKKEKQIQQQDFEIKQRNYWIIAISCLSVLGGLLAYSFYTRNRLKQQAQLQQEIMKQQDIATKAVIEAEERERKRIAGELHDGVGQIMSAAKMNLSALKHTLHFSSDDTKNNFEKIELLIDESCQEVRSVSHNMMPNALLKTGLAAAVREFIDKIDEDVLKINLYTEGLNQRIDANIETVLYRVIQECVNNVIKHAGANVLDISLIKDTDGISVTIEDNGKGFDATAIAKFEGIGLKNIQSRIDYLKGSVEWNSAPGSGTLVAIHIPV